MFLVEKILLVLTRRTIPCQVLCLSKLVGRALIKDDGKASLEKHVADHERSNAQLKLDLEHSNEALAMLQSLYSEKEKCCNGLKSRNLKLHKIVRDVESRKKRCWKRRKRG
jgi:hypothetical protein